MNHVTTTHTGPLGSTVHCLRADGETVKALAAIDWNRSFRRVCLDHVRGLVTLMAPSRLHERLTEIVAHVVDAAGSAVTGASTGLRSTRLRGPADPPGTGMEPDCAFYVGERARDYREAAMAGEAAADTFLEQTAPDLVVEVEITSVDEGKIERYRDLGVRELWRLHGRKGTRDLQVDFLALRPGMPPRPLAASALLGGLTDNDVCEAVDGVRFGMTPQDRIDAVTRIVRRRQRASVRVREADPSYAARSG